MAMSTSKADACARAFLPNYVSKEYLHRAIVSRPIQSRRAPGDGHDFMWYKLTEFTLSLPLCIGFLTTSVSTFMALTLVLEALTAWSWWNSPLGPGYTIHAREHFMVNVVCSRGVASQKVGFYLFDPTQSPRLHPPSLPGCRGWLAAPLPAWVWKIYG